MSNILSKFKSYKLYLVIAILTGSFIRLWGLDRQSLWFDELVSAVPLSHHFRKYFSTMLFNDFHPPLYQLFLYFWSGIFGTSETILRLPGAIAGILAIFIMYFLARKILNKYIAASAAILLAFSSAAIVYAQEARGYSFLLMFSTIATLLWLNLVRKMHDNVAGKKDFLIYGTACLLTIYTHYFGVMFIAFQFVYLFLIAFRLKKYYGHLFTSVWIISCLFVPWFVYHYFRVREIKTAIDWIPKSNLESLIRLIDFIFNKKLIVFLLLPFLANIKKLPESILTETKQLKLDSPVLSLLYLSLIPVLTVFIIGEFVPVFFPRYFIILLPSAYLLISVLISQNTFFSEFKGNIYVFTISLLSLILFLFVKTNNVLDFNPFYTPYKQQWRQTIKYVADNYDNNSMILVDRDPMYYTYYIDRFLHRRVIYINYYVHGGLGLNIDKMDRNKFKRVFIFSNFNRLFNPAERDLLKQCSDLKYEDNAGVILYDCTLGPINDQPLRLRTTFN